MCCNFGTLQDYVISAVKPDRNCRSGVKDGRL